jgi:hypothetical protein
MADGKLAAWAMYRVPEDSTEENVLLNFTDRFIDLNTEHFPGICPRLIVMKVYGRA